MPHPFAGGRVQGHYRGAEQVVARPQAAVEMVGRRGHRQVHVAKGGIATHHRPDVGVAHPTPRLLAPGVVAELAGLRHGLEHPHLLAGVHVEPAHIAERHVGAPVGHLMRVVDGLIADYHHIPAHRRRVVPCGSLPVDAPPQPLREIDPALLAETGVWFARVRRKRDQPAVGGHQQHPIRRLAALRLAAVVGQAAAGEAELRRPRPVAGAGIVGPQRLAGDRVQRRHRRVGRAHEHAPAHHQRRHHEAVRRLPALAGAVVVERLPNPGDAQLRHVVGVDLGQRRVFAGAEVAAVGRPVAVCGGVVECAASIAPARLQGRQFGRPHIYAGGSRRARRHGLARRQPVRVHGVRAPPLAFFDEPQSALVVAGAAAGGDVAEPAVARSVLHRRRQHFGIARHRRRAQQAHADKPSGVAATLAHVPPPQTWPCGKPMIAASVGFKSTAKAKASAMRERSRPMWPMWHWRHWRFVAALATIRAIAEVVGDTGRGARAVEWA